MPATARRRFFVDFVLVPLTVVLGGFAIAAALIEGPALQPFLYGVF
ncbi:MAG: hypothetical protein JNJ88_16720 [Planctomycetes bacterium]|nr:hypothetical protein [Planctomycetota bacterium]